MAKRDTQKDVSVSTVQDRWYYVQPGQSEPVGPLAVEQLRTLLADGMLHKQTKVWRRGMSEWALVSTIDELRINKSLFALAFPSLSKKPEQVQRVAS